MNSRKARCRQALTVQCAPFFLRRKNGARCMAILVASRIFQTSAMAWYALAVQRASSRSVSLTKPSRFWRSVPLHSSDHACASHAPFNKMWPLCAYAQMVCFPSAWPYRFPQCSCIVVASTGFPQAMLHRSFSIPRCHHFAPGGPHTVVKLMKQMSRRTPMPKSYPKAWPIWMPYRTPKSWMLLGCTAHANSVSD